MIQWPIFMIFLHGLFYSKELNDAAFSAGENDFTVGNDNKTKEECKKLISIGKWLWKVDLKWIYNQF